MKYLKGFFFILAFALTGFFVCGWIASLTIFEPSGLAGSTTVAVTALFGTITGILLAIFLLKRISKRAMRAVSILGLIATVAAILIVTPTVATPDRTAPLTTSPKSKTSYSQAERSMGLGMASPKFQPTTLYFYNPNLEKAVDEHFPYDSLVTSTTELGMAVTYAPSWFYPAHQKIDYGILALKVISLTKDWIQLEVNKQTGRTAWLDVSAVTFRSWEVFLLSVYAIETLNPEENPLRSRPLLHSSPTLADGSTFSPIEIRDEWMRVEVFNDSYESVGQGWIRWRKGNELLISYSLLS